MPNSAKKGLFLASRPRRMRHAEFSRRLIRESNLTTNDLIYPMFIIEGEGQREKIDSMPDIERLSVDLLLEEANTLLKLNIPAIALFPVIFMVILPTNAH